MFFIGCMIDRVTNSFTYYIKFVLFILEIFQAITLYTWKKILHYNCYKQDLQYGLTRNTVRVLFSAVTPKGIGVTFALELDPRLKLKKEAMFDASCGVRCFVLENL